MQFHKALLSGVPTLGLMLRDQLTEIFKNSVFEPEFCK